MDDLARRIEHRNMQPAIVPTETCCPDNRPDVVGRKIKGSGRDIERKTSRPGLGVRPDSIGKYVDAPEHALHAGVRARNGFRQVVVHVSDPVLKTSNTTDQADTDVVQHTKVEIAP